MKTLNGLILWSLVVLTLLGGWGNRCFGQTLHGALTQAYKTNPALQAQQAATRAADEGMTRVQSSYRPQVEASSTYGRKNTNITGANSSAPSSSEPASASVTLKQKLLDFKYFPTLEGAEQNIMAARAELLATEQKTLLEGVAAYMTTFEAQEALKAQEHNQRFLEKQLQSTQVRFDAGDVTRTDLAQAKSRLAKARADRMQAQGQLALARASYLKVIGEEPAELAKPNLDIALPATFADLLEKSVKNNPTIEKALANQRAAKATVAQAERSFLPTIDVAASSGRNWERHGNKYRTDSTSVTATLSLPIDFSGAMQSDLRKTHDLFVKSKLETEYSLRSAREEAEKAWESYHVAKKQYEEFSVQIDAAALAVESIQIEEEAGSRTVVDVLDAQRELLNAQVSQVKAYQQFIVAAYQLLSLYGQLTAAELKLDAPYYDPKDHYNEVDNKWWGLGDYTYDDPRYKEATA